MRVYVTTLRTRAGELSASCECDPAPAPSPQYNNSMRVPLFLLGNLAGVKPKPFSFFGGRVKPKLVLRVFHGRHPAREDA